MMTKSRFLYAWKNIEKFKFDFISGSDICIKSQQ